MAEEERGGVEKQDGFCFGGEKYPDRVLAADLQHTQLTAHASRYVRVGGTLERAMCPSLPHRNKPPP